MSWKGQRSQSPRRKGENTRTLSFPHCAGSHGILRPAIGYKLDDKIHNEFTLLDCKDVYC